MPTDSNSTEDARKELRSSSQQRAGSGTEAALVPEVERGAGGFPGSVHRALYGKSDDPEHPDNRESREFLDGYAEGLTCDLAGGLDPIMAEWERRGSPEEVSAGFKEWKRGHNAASLRRAWQVARAKTSDTEPRHSATDADQATASGKRRLHDK